MKLVLENVNRIYEKGGDKTQALCDINVSFHAGEQVMIIGESGRGKSTLLNTIGLLDRGYTGLQHRPGKTHGSIRPKSRQWLRNKMFGYIFQGYALLESESVYDNVRCPCSTDVPRRKHRSKSKSPWSKWA